MGTFSFKIPGESQSQNSHLYPFDSLIFGSRFLHVEFSLDYQGTQGSVSMMDCHLQHSTNCFASCFLSILWRLPRFSDMLAGTFQYLLAVSAITGMSVVCIHITSYTVNNFLASPKPRPVDTLSPRRMPFIQFVLNSSSTIQRS